MRSTELAHENRLASSGGDGVKQPCPRPLSLAGFEVTTVGRFWGSSADLVKSVAGNSGDSPIRTSQVSQ
jgi:hypothetical protein